MTGVRFPRLWNSSASGNSPCLLQPPNLLLLHSLLVFPRLRHNMRPGHSDLPTLQFVFPSNTLYCLLLHQTVFPIRAVETMWLLQANRRIGDNPHISQRIMARRMHHEWMEQIYVPNLPSHLCESLTVLHQPIIPANNMAEIHHREVWLCSGG